MSFVTYMEISFVFFVLGVIGVGYYLKRRGVLRAAANAASAAVAQDVKNVTDKISK